MNTGGSSRRAFIVAMAGSGAAVATGCTRRDAPTHGMHGIDENTEGIAPDEALAKLVEGNARFVSMTEIEPNNSEARLMAVSRGQTPFVGVLGCVDSRVPPELVFDRGLGDVFDARIAGAITDDAAIGSLEFGVEEFEVPLLVVLGHSRCGAVTAAVNTSRSGGGQTPGRIGAVVDPILPAVKSVEQQGVAGDAVVDAAAREIVHRGTDALKSSPVLKERLAAGRLKIVGAFYDLDTGKVEFFA